MAFKATTLIPAQAFEQIRSQALSLKSYLTTARASMAAPISSALIALEVIERLGQVIASMNALATTPGLAVYARDQVNDQSYDVAVEFDAMRVAMVAAKDNLAASFPKDASGFLLYQTLNANGTRATRTFTSAQMVSAVAAIDGVIATIA